MKRQAILAAALAAVVASGCGAGANLAGLDASINVAQKGQVIGVTAVAGTNGITVGASYQQGTNVIAGQATIPTGN